jgi:hypothetical protein
LVHPDKLPDYRLADKKLTVDWLPRRFFASCDKLARVSFECFSTQSPPLLTANILPLVAVEHLTSMPRRSPIEILKSTHKI